MSEWFANGVMIASIAADDRGAQYGDGLFETIAIRDGKARFWDLHVTRLRTSCARLGLTCPATESLQTELDAALAQTNIAVRFATAKLIISAGHGPRGYQRAENARSNLRVGIFASSTPAAAHYRDGVDVRLCTTRLAVQPQLAGLKTLNRLEQILARAEWNDDSVFEGLLQDTDGRLICGTMSNVFIANESGIATPAITRCGVSGIMRAHIIGMLQSAGIECVVDDLSTDDLFAADEVFLSNSQFGILPVRRCDSQRWQVGRWTRQAQALAAANAVPECQP